MKDRERGLVSQRKSGGGLLGAWRNLGRNVLEREREGSSAAVALYISSFFFFF